MVGTFLERTGWKERSGKPAGKRMRDTTEQSKNRYDFDSFTVSLGVTFELAKRPMIGA